MVWNSQSQFPTFILIKNDLYLRMRVKTELRKKSKHQQLSHKETPELCCGALLTVASKWFFTWNSERNKKALKMLKKVLWGHIIYIWLRNVSPSNYTVHQAHPWNCYFLMDCQKRGFVYRESLSWTAFHSFLRLISMSASEGGRERSDSCPLHVATP